MTSRKNSKAFDILINNDDNIEIKSIHSNQENIPFAFQKRDKIPMDNIEMKPPIVNEKETKNEIRKSYSSYSVSSLSNLPYDERPVPTLYNKIKKEREERAKKSVSLMDMLSDEKKAQLSWKKSLDDDLYGNRPKSVVSRSSAYDKQQHRSSMTIIAEVISGGDFNSDSESEYEEENSETNELSEKTENNDVSLKIKLTEDNDSLTNNVNNCSSNNIYPTECIASSIEDIKSNICQVENSSIRTSIVTQEQINKHISHNSISLKKSVDDKNQNIPQLTISLVPEVSSTHSVEEHKLLEYDSTTSLQLTHDNSIKLKKEKKSKKSKKSRKNSISGCNCIIS